MFKPQVKWRHTWVDVRREEDGGYSLASGYIVMSDSKEEAISIAEKLLKRRGADMISTSEIRTLLQSRAASHIEQGEDEVARELLRCAGDDLFWRKGYEYHKVSKIGNILKQWCEKNALTTNYLTALAEDAAFWEDMSTNLHSSKFLEKLKNRVKDFQDHFPLPAELYID